MYRFICMLTVKNDACKLSFHCVKTKNPMLWFCGCTQDMFQYYANCSKKNSDVTPLSLKNKY